MSSTLRESITALKLQCCERKDPTIAQKRQVAAFCQKRYVFDFIYAFRHERRQSLRSIMTVVTLFPTSEAKWAWVLLCALRLPYEDPQGWDPRLHDYVYFQLMLALLAELDLPADEFRDLAEYPLRVSVDALLMSAAFHGCGKEAVVKWQTEEFYEELLSREHRLDLEPGNLSSMELAEDFISSVARLFERHRLERPHLGIGAGFVYYGLDERAKDARNAFLDWLLTTKVSPVLFDLVLAGYLIPQDGLLLPDGEKICAAIDSKQTQCESMLGIVDLAVPLQCLAGLLVGRPPAEGSRAHLFWVGYVLWHAELGIMEQLDDYYIERQK